jgi:FkbM family methyltransferase
MLLKLAARLPDRLQLELKRLRYARQIGRGDFRSPEPEFDLLAHWLTPGRVAIDIGANVGHYTLKLAELAGPNGRVLAFEPVPTTFALLAANVQQSGYGNVTLFNSAASNRTAILNMEVPDWTSGVRNYYQAHLADGGGLSVLSVTIDSLNLPSSVALVKIDAEGHELEILNGMRGLIARDKPVLILEKNSSLIVDLMQEAGYRCGTIGGSPNYVMLPANHNWPGALQEIPRR